MLTYFDVIFMVKVLILGFVEAVSEFLPISSTGHLIIVGDFLDFSGPLVAPFEIFIQLGAVSSVLFIYGKRLRNAYINISADVYAYRLFSNLAIAFLPAASIGFLLHGWIINYLFNQTTVAAAMILGGAVILLIERYAKVQVKTVIEMTWMDALMVGIAQSISLFPGVSRSGATIMGGMLTGMSRFSATEFSFLLAIPTMIAATGYSLFKELDNLSIIDAPAFLFGFFAAFLGGLAVVRFLLQYVGNNSFAPFAYYRIVFGVFLLSVEC